MNDDTISRQAALDELWKLRRAQQMMDATQAADLVMQGIFLAEKKIENLPSASRWIPVSEKPPELVAPSQRREWFITSNTYGGVTITCYEFEASPFKEGWQTDMTILAWMPLPKPYKESE